ncbi:MAG: alpha-D-ribose 1-methylphosphonate 5-triphosphate diphosphatase [Alphaproteobacteria bacterium]|nr:alpha-D-ribose 1-methylphosphonate 5-triphosphate diphosphatase [Alphaproteobacteria bacterium]
MSESIFTNAKIVLADDVVEGSLCIKDGAITDISTGNSSLPAALDMGNDYIMPGMVELHTDNLEKHLMPRPKAHWPALSAVIAHDNEIISAGITTVFDSLAIGDADEDSPRVKRLPDMINGLELCRKDKLLRADHLLHLRCEVSFGTMEAAVRKVIDNDMVRLISVMDHTPGQRQFVSLDAYYTYYKGKLGYTDSEMAEFITQRRSDQKAFSANNRRFVVAEAHRRGYALASHDDATKEHVAEAVDDKMTVAEFPTTLEAAQSSHENGLSVLMGGPNVVRGGSHSGNIAATDLAKEGYLDIISSDYVPHSMLHAAMILFEDLDNYDLPKAIRTVTKTPAESVGLFDRGEIAIGKRADLIHVHHTPHHPVIRSVWSEGRRVS